MMMMCDERWSKGTDGHVLQKGKLVWLGGGRKMVREGELPLREKRITIVNSGDDNFFLLPDPS